MIWCRPQKGARLFMAAWTARVDCVNKDVKDASKAQNDGSMTV